MMKHDTEPKRQPLPSEIEALLGFREGLSDPVAKKAERVAHQIERAALLASAMPQCVIDFLMRSFPREQMLPSVPPWRRASGGAVSGALKASK